MLVTVIVGIAAFALGLFIGALLIQADEAKKRLASEQAAKESLATQFTELHSLAQKQAAYIEQQCADIEEMQTMMDMREARRN